MATKIYLCCIPCALTDCTLYPGTVLLVAGLGNMLEWFDFAVFGACAVWPTVLRRRRG